MATDLSGKELAGFRVERELGSGGMGAVWLAEQPSLGRPAVLKQIRPDLAAIPELEARFEREARAAAALHHPNVVAIYDLFTWRTRRFIAQEYVEGTDLASALDRTGPLPPRMASLIAVELLRGLGAIHGPGTVHRDLKPANVLLGREGQVKIADFGLALEPGSGTLTEPGVAIGSPTYMPPEQMMADRVDARADLFSFGVIFYEMLCGRVPYPQPGEGDDESLLRRMQREKPPKLRRLAPGTPRAVARMIERCLRADPSRRPTSAASLRRVLERVLGRPSVEEGRDELGRWLRSANAFDDADVRTRAVGARAQAEGPGSVGEEEDAVPERWHPIGFASALLAGTALGALLLLEVGLLPETWTGRLPVAAANAPPTDRAATGVQATLPVTGIPEVDGEEPEDAASEAPSSASSTPPAEVAEEETPLAQAPSRR